MPKTVFPGPIDEELRSAFREAVNVHTNKIYDSCKDKDCIEDLRLYPTAASLSVIENAVSLRPKKAELLYVAIDVEEVTFNRGYYTIDMQFFYKITADAYSLINRSAEVTGLTVFNKRVILFGSEGNAKIFTSGTLFGSNDILLPERSKLPTAVVEAVDPIILSIKIADVVDTDPADDTDLVDVPEFISSAFTSPLTLEAGSRRALITLGQFSIVRLERDAQLLIPSYDNFVPTKECGGSSEDDPCALFSKICFPVDEFFPPDTLAAPEGYRDALANLTK